MEQTNQPTKELTKSQIYYRKYKATILAAQKRYYEKNKEEKRAYQRGYVKWKKEVKNDVNVN